MPTAVNPQTGERLELINGQWQPVQQPAPALGIQDLQRDTPAQLEQRLQQAPQPGILTPEQQAEQINQAFRQFSAVTPSQQTGTLQNLLTSFGRGATFGGLVELVGLLAPTVTGRPGQPAGEVRELATEFTRNLQEQARQQNPIGSRLAELGGALMTGAAAFGPLATSSFGLTRPITTGAGIGGVSGALFGAGEAEEDRGTAALTGAALGAPLGAGATFVGQKIGAELLPFISKSLGGAVRSVRQQADDLIRPFLKESGTLQQLTSRARQLGPEATLSDVGGPPIEALTGAFASKNQGFRKQITDLLSSRGRQAVNRISGSVNRLLGTTGKDFANTAKQNINNKIAQSNPLYAEAYSTPVPRSQVRDFVSTMDDFIRENTGTTQARELQKFKNALFKLTPDGRKVLKTDVRALQRARKSFADKVNKLYVGGERQTWNDLKPWREAFDESVMPETYRRANRIFSDESAVGDALAAGRRVLRDDVDDITDFVGTLSDAEREAYLIGAVRGITDKIKSTQAGGKVTTEFNKPLVQERLRPIFPDQQSFARFMRDIETENVFTSAKNAITGNSFTQFRQEAVKLFEQRAGAAVPESREAIARRVLDFIRLPQAGIPQPVQDQLSRRLTQQGLTRETLEEILREPRLQSQLPALLQEITPEATAGLTTGLTGQVVPGVAGL